MNPWMRRLKRRLLATASSTTLAIESASTPLVTNATSSCDAAASGSTPGARSK
jgi:hypothetical protein